MIGVSFVLLTHGQVRAIQFSEMQVPYCTKYQVVVPTVIAGKTYILNASTPRTNVLYWYQLHCRCVGRLLVAVCDCPAHCAV